MPPRPRLQPLATLLYDRIGASEMLAESCPSFRESRSGAFRNLRRRSVYLIMELAFLRIFLAWEDFLEQSFVRYMCGGVTASGYRPQLYVNPVSLDHAYDILRGQRAFVEWSNGRDVLQRARLFFKNGHPYDPAIGGALQELDEMRILRNGIAHRSATAIRQFEDLARRLLGHRPRGLAPGLLLASLHLPSQRTYLHHYSEVIKVVAYQIVP